MNKNPNASQKQYENYMEKKSPDFLKKYKNVSEIQKLVRADTNFFDNSLDFIKLGINHILEGTDHILFIISLLLVFLTIHEILRLTSTFTIAHSLTILLSATAILTVSPRIVEPIIALSIAFVAFGSVFLAHYPVFREGKAKLGIVFFFGLFHGLGFAGLLKEIHIPNDRFISSLISFNIGIEIGQMIVVCIALPVIFTFRHKSWYPSFIKVVAVIITIFGIIWAFQRIFQ